jgi:hypothetical protein
MVLSKYIYREAGLEIVMDAIRFLLSSGTHHLQEVFASTLRQRNQREQQEHMKERVL